LKIWSASGILERKNGQDGLYGNFKFISAVPCRSFSSEQWPSLNEEEMRGRICAVWEHRRKSLNGRTRGELGRKPRICRPCQVAVSFEGAGIGTIGRIEAVKFTGKTPMVESVVW
jgi:hypothetical protein